MLQNQNSKPQFQWGFQGRFDTSGRMHLGLRWVKRETNTMSLEMLQLEAETRIFRWTLEALQAIEANRLTTLACRGASHHPLSDHLLHPPAEIIGLSNPQAT
jgi:hypothetical protein